MPASTYRRKPCLVKSCTKDSTRLRVVCTKHHEQASRYGLSDLRVVELLNAPCEICGSYDTIHIDHDHNCCPSGSSCGECVRGGLCMTCNLALGYVHDDPKIIASMLTYLQRA